MSPMVLRISSKLRSSVFDGATFFAFAMRESLREQLRIFSTPRPFGGFFCGRMQP